MSESRGFILGLGRNSMDMGASPSPPLVASSAPPVRVFVADVNTYVSNHVARAFANQGYAVYGSLQQLDPATRAFQSVTSRSVLSAPEQTPPGSRGGVVKSRERGKGTPRGADC